MSLGLVLRVLLAVAWCAGTNTWSFAQEDHNVFTVQPAPPTPLDIEPEKSAGNPAAEVVEVKVPSALIETEQASLVPAPVLGKPALESVLPAPAPGGSPTPGDPEWVRGFPDDDPLPTPVASKLARNHVSVSQWGDPEFARSWPADGVAGALVNMEHTPDADWTAARPQPLIDSPRFEWGQGLDDPAADLAAREPLIQAVVESIKPPKKGSKNTTAKPPADPQAAEKRKALAAARAALEKFRKTGKPGEAPIDPALVHEIKLQQINDQLAEVAKQRAKLGLDAPGATGTGEKPAVLTKSEQVLRAFENRPLGRVVGTILDKATKKPIPARVKITDAGETVAAPDISDLGFWCDGAFDVPVVAGRVRVEIRAGRFRHMFLKDVAVSPEVPVVIEAVLEQPEYSAFARRGWYLCDLNRPLRARRGEMPVWIGEPPGFGDAMLAAVAEGVQVLGLSMPWDAAAERAPEAEIHKTFAAGLRAGLLVFPTFPGPQHPFCGSALGIGVTQWTGNPMHLIDPCSSLRDGFDAIRTSGGLAAFTELTGRRNVDPHKAVLPLFPRLVQDGFLTDKDTNSRMYGPAELPFATLTQAYDALVYDGSKEVLDIWFTLLNEGYALPIVGSGGGSLEGGCAPYGHTFVKVDRALTREAVLDACRIGRSFVSFGPALFADILERARGPGDRVAADGMAWNLRLKAYASLQPGTTLEMVEIIRNGKVLKTERFEQGLTLLHEHKIQFSENQDAWYVVRLTEKEEIPGQPVKRRVALTNPIYFDTQSREFPKPAVAGMSGVLRRPGGTPTAGTLTILDPVQEPREVEVGAEGHFSVTFSAAGAVIFSALGCEPAARKPFENPEIQKALGDLHAERRGPLDKQLALREVYGRWRMLLKDWRGDVVLKPLETPAPELAAPAAP